MVKDDVDVNDGAGESVHHERCSHLALGHAAVLSRRKLGGCALLILRQPTSDAVEQRATIIVNHLAQSPPPAATATVNNACCAEARGWGAEGNRHPGSETGLQLGSTIYPYLLKWCTDTSVWQPVCLSVLTICTPSLGTDTELQSAVCSQRPIGLPTHQPSFLIMRRSVIRAEHEPHQDQRSWLVWPAGTGD